MKLVAAAMVLCATATAGPRHWTGDHAEAKVGAHASLTADGPWLPGAVGAFTVLAARDTIGERPQVESYGDGVRLWVYADPAGLADVTTSETMLVPSLAAIEATDGQMPGMQLGAGTDFADVGVDNHGQTGVTIRWPLRRDDPKSGGLEVHGYVPTATLGKTFNSVASSFKTRPPDVSLRPNIELLDAPNGKPFATIKNDRYARAAKLAHDGAFTLVQLEYSGVIGWVASRQIIKLGNERPPEVAGELVEGGEDRSTLPPQIRLYDAIDGHVIGETIGGFEYPVMETTRGWRRYDVKTTFGNASVWAR